jgi:type II secretory pathway pseudopilin PulG
MIHSKNLKNSLPGFSFMEVMIAIIMLGMLLTAILNLQNTSFNSVVDYSARLRYIFSLRNRLVTAALERAEQKEEKSEQPKAAENGVKISYALKKINEKSVLKKFENCFIEKADAQWQEGRKKRQETMITFLYKAPEKKENEKK